MLMLGLKGVHKECTAEVVSDVYLCMYRSFAHYFIVFVHVKHENPQ